MKPRRAQAPGLCLDVGIAYYFLKMPLSAPELQMSHPSTISDSLSNYSAVVCDKFIFTKTPFEIRRAMRQTAVKPRGHHFDSVNFLCHFCKRPLAVNFKYIAAANHLVCRREDGIVQRCESSTSRCLAAVKSYVNA